MSFGLLQSGTLLLGQDAQQMSMIPRPDEEGDWTTPSTAVPGVSPSESTADFGKASWIVVARIVSQVSQFVIIILAARFIAPAEFGIFALLSAVGIGLARFSEAGWREYIMVTEHEDMLAQTHTLALCSGLMAMVVGLVVSLVIEELGAGHALALVMAMLSVWTLLATLSAIQSGILVRRGAFAVLAQAQIAGEVVGLIAAVAVFAAGGGVLGLAIAKLLTQAVAFFGSLVASRWFQLRRPRGSESRKAFHFSLRILATRLIAYAHDNVALFAIGALTGSVNAGLYRASGRLAGAMNEIINEPVRVMAWSILQRQNAAAVMDQLLVVTILLATPLFVGLAVTSHDVIFVFLGDQWTAAAPLLTAFSIGGIFALLNVATEPLLASNGHVALVPKLSIGFTLAATVVLVALAPAGIFWIAVGQTVLAAILLPVVMWIQHRYSGTSPTRILQGAYPAAVGAILLIAAVLLVDWWIGNALPPAVLLAVKVAAGAFVYCATVLVLVPFDTLRLRAETVSAIRSKSA